MATRDELKSLIDQLPESRLQMVRTMLNHQVNPPPPNPDIERMQQRSQNYRTLVEQRFRETGKPGTIRSMGGDGFSGMHEGTLSGATGLITGMTKHLCTNHCNTSMAKKSRS